MTALSTSAARRRVHDADFLPAVAEIAEMPPSPVGRAMLWAIVTLSAALLAWACFGRVDVIAAAQGVVLPAGRVRLVQPLSPGIVAAIHVRNGDSVRVGDLLVELDATAARADAAAARQASALAAVEAARLRAWLAMLGDDLVTEVRIVAPPEADEALLAEGRAHLAFQSATLRARLAGLRDGLEKARAGTAEIAAEIGRIEATLPLAAELSEARDLLAGRGLGSRLEALQERQRLLSQRGDLLVLRSRLDGARNEVSALEHRRREVLAEAGRDASAALSAAQARMAAAREDLAKAEGRIRESRLLAPADGIVEGLAAHTVGGVVGSGQTILSVVPRDEALEIEARLASRDVAFVTVGQPAIVKLDAYPFTRFGTLNGTVTHLPGDAARDEAGMLAYAVRVTLPAVPPGFALRAGMGATVEVLTGRRRLIEYILSPLERRASEAFRER
ncbi:HlyD family type I secretion periplasmic adaptor subunit [Roseomonas sp. CCTCC AB2023176]|uniref:HlyD family type I secretion periplasmic adaptor subunit n=1 Tax=Roseomonas sp. CCTCC AB2023176 TaxID=3342640 RepID=UPI0035D7AEAC